MAGRFVLSLDFELAWGSPERWGDTRFLDHAVRAWDAALGILRACAAHDIRGTWAVVGGLFARDVAHFAECAPPEEARPDYRNPEMSPYRRLDALERADSRAFFCPDLLREIRGNGNQEIASHTFSHYYCLEPGPPLASFEADVMSFRAITRGWDIAGSSLVLPRNQVSLPHLEVAARHGFTAFRGSGGSPIWRAGSRTERSTLKRTLRIADAYLPLSDGAPGSEPCQVLPGLVDVPSTHFLRWSTPSRRWLDRVQVARIVRALRVAAESGGSYHVWFHPENFTADLQRNLRLLTRILEEVSRLRDAGTMRSLTMAQMASEVKSA